MAPLPFVFLANRGNLTRAKLSRAIRHRLGKEPGCTDVRLSPSRARPRSVQASVEPTAFLGQAYRIEEATLEVAFAYPRSVDYEYYVIEWSEAERDLGIGWHQDETHPDLGECHFQVDRGASTVDWFTAEFVDDHPLEVLETRLEQLRAVLSYIEWDDGEPVVTESDLPGPP